MASNENDEVSGDNLSIDSSGFGTEAYDAHLEIQITELQSRADFFEKEFKTLKAQTETQNQIQNSKVEEIKLELKKIRKIKEDFEINLEKERAAAQQRESSTKNEMYSRVLSMEKFYQSFIYQIFFPFQNALDPDIMDGNFSNYYDTHFLSIQPFESESPPSESQITFQACHSPPPEYSMEEIQPYETASQEYGTKRKHSHMEEDENYGNEIDSEVTDHISKKFLIAIPCKWKDCDKAFSNDETLKTHLIQAHFENEEKICQWSNCNRSEPFKASYMLKKHYEKQHINEINELPNTASNPFLHHVISGNRSGIQPLEEFFQFCKRSDDIEEPFYVFSEIYLEDLQGKIKLIDERGKKHVAKIENIKHHENLLKNIWILSKLTLIYSTTVIQSSILQKIVFCQAKIINLANINLAQIHFDVLIESGNIEKWKSIGCNIFDNTNKLISIAYIFSKMAKARELTLHPCNITSSDITELFKCYWKNTEIEELSLAGIGNEMDAASFFEFIKYCLPQRVTLNLNFLDSNFGEKFEDDLHDLIVTIKPKRNRHRLLGMDLSEWMENCKIIE